MRTSEADIVAVLADEAADVAAPVLRQLTAVGGGDDLVLGVVGEPPQWEHLGDQLALARAGRGKDHELALGAAFEERGDLLADEPVVAADLVGGVEPARHGGRVVERLEFRGVRVQLSIRQTGQIRHTPQSLPECLFCSGDGDAALPEGLDDHGSAAANPPEFRCSVYEGRPRPATRRPGRTPIGRNLAMTQGALRGLDARRLEASDSIPVQERPGATSDGRRALKELPDWGLSSPPLVVSLTRVVTATSSRPRLDGFPRTRSLHCCVGRANHAHLLMAATGTHRVTRGKHRV